ncbi:hypothetical protein GWK41_00495 [Persephonella atlantica]|uniref:Uncharacterized protein n=1 Tax=Persephonella atlantica TaxID=2699429 RepID=A0ABS1GF44_9AQUI|nr:hypothetical protein [Persephonella atlantica]MBK3331540.1 hypothetical protein [Persephonella atlantica]
MKRDFYLFGAGLLTGLFLSAYLYWKRKQIINRLNAIEQRLTGKALKSSVKTVVYETVSKVRKLLINTKGVPLEEKEYILKKVEEKIRRLEEIV